METPVQYGGTSTGGRDILPPGARIGSVRLESGRIEELSEFYRRRIGLKQIGRRPGLIELGVENEILLTLEEVPEISRQPRSAGLFHFAIRLPERRTLASVVRKLLDEGTAIGGFADHLVSEALYLGDPDGNGVEIYHDRPRKEWFEQGRLRMDTLPLDLEDLLSEISSPYPGMPDSLPPGTVVGHVHLRVSDLAATERFYTHTLGYELTMRFGSQAGFVSAGGYHHHVGYNTWGGPFEPRSRRASGGLKHFTILLPDEPELERTVGRLRVHDVEVNREGQAYAFRDPSGIQVLLRKE
jgi:catechol 2,3-dioxygenase